MAKRRLKNTDKVELFGLAISKFVDKKLRSAEDKAGKAFAKSLVADWKKSISPVVPYLQAMGVNSTVKTVELPELVPVMATGQEFTRPDGVQVKRDDKMVAMSAPLARTMNKNEETMRAFVNGGEDRPYLKVSSWSSRHARSLISSLELPESIFLSTNTLKLEYTREKNKDPEPFVFQVNGKVATWISQKTLDLLVPFFEAGKARADAENILWRSIGRLIWTSISFEDLLHYWPEAKMLEADLFPPKSLGALVPVSAAEQEALCRNMSSRGVEAPICAIAA
ncbi:hypothetical protein [Agrobacterium sp. CG674]